MIKSEYKEAAEQDNYWYDKSIFHKTDDVEDEHYDRPIGGVHFEDYERDTLSDYESCIHHFSD